MFVESHPLSPSHRKKYAKYDLDKHGFGLSMSLSQRHKAQQGLQDFRLQITRVIFTLQTWLQDNRTARVTVCCIKWCLTNKTCSQPLSSEQSFHCLPLHVLMLWSLSGIKYHANPLPVSCPPDAPMSSAKSDHEHGCEGCGHP